MMVFSQFLSHFSVIVVYIQDIYNFVIMFSSGPPTSATKNVAPKTVQPKSTEENNKFPEAIGPTQPFLALPTTPIIIIPYSLIRGANVLPGPL